jgi:hypothetical protein
LLNHEYRQVVVVAADGLTRYAGTKYRCQLWSVFVKLQLLAATPVQFKEPSLTPQSYPGVTGSSTVCFQLLGRSRGFQDSSRFLEYNDRWTRNLKENMSINMTFEILTAVNILILVFSVVTPRGLVDRYQLLGRLNFFILRTR